MNNLNCFLLATVLLSYSNTALADQRFSCNTEQLNNAEPLVENIIDRILTIGNIKQRYYICRLPHSKNAIALIYKNKRIIAYDAAFIDRLSRKAGEQYWGRVAALAHEIGHHIYRHTDKLEKIQRLPKLKSLAIQREYELQADQFAGRVMANMGASLDNSQALISTLTIHRNEIFSDHPDVNKRISRVTLGWNIGCQQARSNCNSQKYKHRKNQQVLQSPLSLVGKKETPNYLRFMQQAEKLKGALVNQAYCNLYASLAVQQTKRSQQHHCGFNIDTPTASQWSTAFAPQANWCMQASAYATANEAKFRETKLADCIR